MSDAIKILEAQFKLLQSIDQSLSRLVDQVFELSEVVQQRKELPAASPSYGNGKVYQYIDFFCNEISSSIDDNGNPAYKAKGFPFTKFGVRLWPEVLPKIGLDPDSLQLGPNSFNAMLRAVLTDEGTPKKVIGLSPKDAQPQASNPANTEDISF